MYNLTVDGRMMKYIALLIFILCTTVFCMIEPNEYIDGKWYNCTSVTYNDNGDTLYTSQYGRTDKYFYDTTRKLILIKGFTDDKLSFTTHFVYDSSGNIIKKVSNNTVLEFKRDKSGHIIEQTETYKHKRFYTTRFYYDTLGNEIYSETRFYDKYTDKMWKNYDGNRLISSKTLTTYKDGTVESYKQYYSDGTIKYDSTWRWSSHFVSGCKIEDENCFILAEQWFDHYGNVMRQEVKRYAAGQYHSDTTIYNNQYDEYGRITYDADGVAGTHYIYFDKGNTHYKCIDE